MKEAYLKALEGAFSEAPFDDDVANFFRTAWHHKTFKKGEFITEAGNRERYFYLMLGGVQMLYLIDAKGEKVVLGFTFSGEFSGVYDSLMTNKPADYFLEALTDTECLRISSEDYKALFEDYTAFDRWGRLFIQRILLGRVSREVELLTKSAEERFVAFMRRCPPALRDVPQKYIASYLNMKPETFSRLRASADY